MIHDSLTRIDVYRPLSKNIARAIDYIAATDLNALAAGKHEVDGDRVFALMFDVQTIVGGAKWEAHRKYIDLQLMVRGRERQEVGDIDNLDGATPFDVEKDVMFFESARLSVSVDLQDGQFALYFPHDGHKPMIAVDGAKSIRKLVMKIAV